MHAYRDAIEAGRFATARGVVLSRDDRLRRSVIERIMCDMRVDLGEICAAFSESPSLFSPELARLRDFAEDGIVEIAGREIRVRPDARPLLRCVAAVFDAYLDSTGGRHARAI